MMGRRLGPVAATGLGVMTAGPMGFLAGAAGRGIGGRIGRSLDIAAGTSEPEVLARERVLRREAARRGITSTNMAPEIEGLTRNAKARLRATQQAQAAAEAQAQAQRQAEMDHYNAAAEQLGLERGGGWTPAITAQANGAIPGAGVDIRDPLAAVNDLARAGFIKPDRAQELLTNRTARPTEAEMRLITDYVVTTAAQVAREGFQAPQGTQAQPMASNQPVARVGNPEAYSAKMRQVAAINETIMARAAEVGAVAKANAVISAKSKASKEAAFGGGTGDPVLDGLLRSHIDMTSPRSG